MSTTTTARDVIADVLTKTDPDGFPWALAGTIVERLKEQGFEISPDKVTTVNTQVEVDMNRPEATIPWKPECNLCQSFRKDADDNIGLFTFVGAVARHFDQHHDIDLIR